MSDTTKGLQFAGAGNPAETSPAQQPTQPAQGEQQIGDTQQYITKAEVLALIKEETKRMGQSIGDKATARIQQEITRLQKAGINATPEQVQQLVAEETVDSAKPSAQHPPQGVQQGGQQKPAVVITAEEMLIEAGIDPDKIDDKDPDYGLINFKGTRTQFLQSVEAYIEAKEARKGNQARVPVVGAGAAGKAGSKAALTAEYMELSKHPTQNYARIQQIAGELAKLK